VISVAFYLLARHRVRRPTQDLPRIRGLEVIGPSGQNLRFPWEDIDGNQPIVCSSQSTARGQIRISLFSSVIVMLRSRKPN
jgi:hypothetical protein